MVWEISMAQTGHVHGMLGRTFTRLTRVSLVTRVSRRFFEGPFRPYTHRKISRKPPGRTLFFCAKVGLHETLVIVPSEDGCNPKKWRCPAKSLAKSVYVYWFSLLK